MPKAILFAAVVSLLLVCGPAFTAPVVFERHTAIRSEPRLDAPVRANVAEGTTGDAAERRGPWLAVRTPAGNGWVLSFNVRYGATSSKKASGANPSALNALNSVTGRNVTATIGVRGIEKDGREHAKFDARQLSLLEKSRATGAQARAAAAATGLRPRDVDFFEER
jgi:hypothetical protein